MSLFVSVMKGEVILYLRNAVVGGNSARSLALLLATACVGGIFASFAQDIGEKVSSLGFMVVLLTMTVTRRSREPATTANLIR